MKPLALEWIRRKLAKARRDLHYAEEHNRPLTDRHNLQATVQVLEWLQEIVMKAE